jgi:starch synthase
MPKILQNSSQANHAVEILHVALEYGSATLGGLGAVTTQMLKAQSVFKISDQQVFNPSIITPYYKKLYSYKTLQHATTINHLYEAKTVASIIYLYEESNKRHYLIEPDPRYNHMFDIYSVNDLYNNLEASSSIDRLKYFNSATAAFVHNQTSCPIVFLHDWQTALVPKLLKEVHHNHRARSIFVVHVSNLDYGGFNTEMLQGIGLKFDNKVQLLKAIGLYESDKIVAVSQQFMQECLTERSGIAELEYLRKLFVLAYIKDNLFGITNGFDHNKFNPIGRLIPDYSNIVASKHKLKLEIIHKLCHSTDWKINPDLPVIFYVGRYSPEKGVDTFEQLIRIVRDRAIFFAVGRGKTERIASLIEKHSRKTSNIFITNDEEEQNTLGMRMRACAVMTFIPSHREACGLVPMEAFANGSLCITSGVGGLKDSVKQLKYQDKDNTTGNAFIYEDQESGDNPDLAKAVDQALKCWNSLSISQKNSIHLRLMEESKQYDWLAPAGAILQYYDICRQLKTEPVTKDSNHEVVQCKKLQPA